ncbi:MAG: ABC transporter substrate-binding protein [Desulfobacterales bacterium]|nr:ABC transporter substrate-binding protein [Desulfobacterales bacterium]
MKCFSQKNWFKVIILTVFCTALLVGGDALAVERGGILTLCTSSSVKTLDPHKVVGDESYHATFHIFSTLTRIGSDLTAKPELAESWEHTDKAMTWTFHLNNKAKFHNGRPVTADDVKFSLDRVLDPKQSPRGHSKIGPIKEVIVKDKHTVVIKLTKPYLDLPVDLGSVFPRIIAKENLNEINTKPIGSGPFKLTNWQMGGITKLVKNDDYFLMGEDDKPLPYVDEFRIVPIKENSSQLAAIQSGSVDIMYRLSYDLIPTAKKSNKVVVIGGPTLGYQPLVLNLDPVIAKGQDEEKMRIFRNAKVREAFAYILDRKAMLNIALGGLGTIGNDQPIPSFHAYANKNIKPKKQDIALAKKLLAEAGVKPGTHFKLYTSAGRAGMSEMAVAFQQMAKKADIVIDVEMIDISRYWTDYDFKAPFIASNWGGRGTINASLKPYYYTGGSSNESHYSNPELDKILDLAESESDFEKRKALYGQVQQIVSDACVTIIPYYKNFYSAATPMVQGLEVHPITYLYVDHIWKKK